MKKSLYIILITLMIPAYMQGITTTNAKINENLKEIIALHSKLIAARENFSDLGKWGIFARQFNINYTACFKGIDKVEPLTTRLKIAELLTRVGYMFNATAFENKKDYAKESEKYDELLHEIMHSSIK